MSKEFPLPQHSIFSLTNHELFVITARDGDRVGGQIATWIVPATLAAGRQRVVAVISPENYTHDLIAASGSFVLNMLADHQQELVPRFGLYSGRDVDKFEGLQLANAKSGIPILADTCGWALCEIVAALDCGDRMVYIADVTGQQLDPARRPLRKNDAFEALPPAVRLQLEEKQRRDGIRDAALIKQPIVKQ
jgi:flavin reductase (DIM6/NTAB) family NADH-FMN oxidoreductase RutF